MRRTEWSLASGLLLALLMPAARALPLQLANQLAQLPADTQQRLRIRDEKWRALTAVEQQVLRQRIAAWDRLPPANKRQRREAWQAWQALPAAQQLQVRAAATAFAALPLEQQQALRAQFAQRDGSEQHEWLLGPALGVGFPALQPLLLQVPDGERQPLLAVLRTLSPSQLSALGVLAQRTPPTQRDNLRRALLSTTPDARGQWLRLQLAR
jgi:hypothetical protein